MKFKRIILYSTLFIFSKSLFAQKWRTILLEDFGTGVDTVVNGSIAKDYIAPGVTNYIPYTISRVNYPIYAALQDGFYTVTKNASILSDYGQNGGSAWIKAGDHTLGTGYMMLINANPGRKGEKDGSYYIYATKALNLPGANYRINFYTANVLNIRYDGGNELKKAYIGLAIRDNANGTGNLYNSVGQRDWILDYAPSMPTTVLPWQNITSNFSLPSDYSGEEIFFNFYNTDPDPTNYGGGNDLVLDDIRIEIQIVDFKGNVFHDKNGNGVKDAGEDFLHRDKNNNQLYAYITKSNGNIISKVSVQSDGSYAFDADNGIPYISSMDIGMKIIISNKDIHIDSLITGNNLDGIGAVTEIVESGITSTGINTKDGIINILNSSADKENVNYGLNYVPEADDISYNLNYQPLPNDLISLNGTNAPLLRGSDVEDKPVIGSLIGEKIAITELPSQANLKYKGTTILTGQDGVNPPSLSNPFIIDNLAASDLAIEFVGSGYSSVQFKYSFYDNLDLMSSSATYELLIPYPLPVELIKFNAYETGDCNVYLDWAVGTEKNVKQYTIQATDNLYDYVNVDSVAPKGGNSSYVYSFKNTNHYEYLRLRIEDYDNTYKYSKIVKINNKCSSRHTVRVYPNPFSNLIFLDGLMPNDNITMYDVLGRTLISANANNNTMSLSVKDLYASNYYVVIKHSDGTTSTFSVSKSN